MKKRTASFLTAFILLVAVAFALNGSVISITNTTPYSGGGTGALQCVYSTTADQSRTTKWQIRKLKTIPPFDPWGGLRTMGTTAGSITTGPNYVDYEVQFVPQIQGDYFTGTNPQAVRVYPNKLSVVTIHYQ